MMGRAELDEPQLKRKAVSQTGASWRTQKASPKVGAEESAATQAWTTLAKQKR
jgi:hypothetical protein